MKTFTDEQVTEAIEKVVAERGEDYVYDNGRTGGADAGCYYSAPDGESPSCIVGFVMNALNPEAFKKVVGVETAAWESFDVADALAYADGEFNISSEARRALQKAQDKQDGGQTWGYSLGSYKLALNGSDENFIDLDDDCDCGCQDGEMA